MIEDAGLIATDEGSNALGGGGILGAGLGEAEWVMVIWLTSTQFGIN
ncbi:hypothetical protein PL10110_660012 [Planktothrix agardhii]|nr:hypothetical protein PL10110_660012 [Planktothrix agardhii]